MRWRPPSGSPELASVSALLFGHRQLERVLGRRERPAEGQQVSARDGTIVARWVLLEEL